MHSQVNLFDDSSSNSSHGRQTTYSHARTLSVPVSPHAPEGSTIPEEVQLDYLEIASIPPLPLYALLAADHDTTLTKTMDGSNSRGKSDNQDYGGLFHAEMALRWIPKLYWSWLWLYFSEWDGNIYLDIINHILHMKILWIFFYKFESCFIILNTNVINCLLLCFEVMMSLMIPLMMMLI